MAKLLGYQHCTDVPRAYSRQYSSGAVVLQQRSHLATRACDVVQRRCNVTVVRSASASESVVPENVDLDDPELQKQIDAILKELDPDLLLDDTRELLTSPAAAAAANIQQQQGQRQQQVGPNDSSSLRQADAWQESPDDEDIEAGLPEGVVLTQAEYKRKAAVLVEFITALQQGESAQEAFEQQLSSFRADIDEALLHMLSRRIEAARQLEQDPEEVTALTDLFDVLKVEYEKVSATPAMRLLDECLDILGDDPYLPGARVRAEQVVQRLRNAFTGGAAANIDIFAAAAALAEDKALAADALAVEFVPQVLFVQEGLELLQQAKDDMQQLTCAVTEAQYDIQKARKNNPQLLESQEAKQHIQQVEAADAALQRRKLAVGQLAYVLDIAQDLDAAERTLAVEKDNAGGEQMENLAALLGME
eukprot:GHUV01008909.1.p1 GENE.GHUV01008909.1~~GHUV01008909.1.p1  ORF type:complete len:420 (+),score=159.62 GHUV01008909.1:1558-2817(+)